MRSDNSVCSKEKLELGLNFCLTEGLAQVLKIESFKLSSAKRISRTSSRMKRVTIQNEQSRSITN